jgi:hypothetical protein
VKVCWWYFNLITSPIRDPYSCNNAVSFDQVLDYLETAGTLQPFLLEILCQHAIDQELQSQASLSPEAIEQMLIDFRIQQELTNSEEFQAWLEEQGITYEILREQLAQNLALEHLKFQVSQPNTKSINFCYR